MSRVELSMLIFRFQPFAKITISGNGKAVIKVTGN